MIGLQPCVRRQRAAGGLGDASGRRCCWIASAAGARVRQYWCCCCCSPPPLVDRADTQTHFGRRPVATLLTACHFSSRRNAAIRQIPPMPPLMVAAQVHLGSTRNTPGQHVARRGCVFFGQQLHLRAPRAPLSSGRKHARTQRLRISAEASASKYSARELKKALSATVSASFENVIAGLGNSRFLRAARQCRKSQHLPKPSQTRRTRHLPLAGLIYRRTRRRACPWRTALRRPTW